MRERWVREWRKNSAVFLFNASLMALLFPHLRTLAYARLALDLWTSYMAILFIIVDATNKKPAAAEPEPALSTTDQCAFCRKEIGDLPIMCADCHTKTVCPRCGRHSKVPGLDRCHRCAAELAMRN